MARQQIQVPFGYVEPKATMKGTMIVFDLFEDWDEDAMQVLIQYAEEKSFEKVVLYPQHEETLKRMGIKTTMPYYARVKHLHSLLKMPEANDTFVEIDIDEWEGKRKKYTPLDTSLRFLTEKNKGPYFVFMPDIYANIFAAITEFDMWIKQLRMLIDVKHVPALHPKLQALSHRWDVISFVKR
ncbi:hypothetical protein NV379_01380 [Paenibacillus sp. N1-5-1-14]|uniref:hypothetical protein n=1 Tax=Paenibacillus radicibacter TaxID=2972488 RepID=UPI00215935CC|nr:hypothetical protein [Paenibacillus radicibacter]MCR8641295.1 hypothetical protein [Paenibacillus radicibacter]